MPLASLVKAVRSCAHTGTSERWRQWRHGDLREAYDSFATSVEQTRAWGTSIGGAYAEAFTVRTLIDLGWPGEARTYLEQLRSQIRVADGWRLFNEAEAMLCIAEERYAAALAILDGLAQVPSSIVNRYGVRGGPCAPWRSPASAGCPRPSTS